MSANQRAASRHVTTLPLLLARFAAMFGRENTSSLVPSGTQGAAPATSPGPSVLSGKQEVSFQ